MEKIIDIREDELDPEVLKRLLWDHSRRKVDDKPDYIVWATDDYAWRGEGYRKEDRILPERVRGEGRERIIMPRVLKLKSAQVDRTKAMAEVFTPSWICNAQNNLIDDVWFGRKGVFNEQDDAGHSWKTNPDKIDFAGTGKTWLDYVVDTRLEITCGEAPYLASRYDTTTGEYIEVRDRIGMLDRKLRVVAENTDGEADFVKYARRACQSVYGYEFQGDSLLLAREAVYQSFLDHYHDKFGDDAKLSDSVLQYVAYVVSWNIFQMDGINCYVPYSAYEEESEENTLFGVSKSLVKYDGVEAQVAEWNDPERKYKSKYSFLKIRNGGAKLASSRKK